MLTWRGVLWYSTFTCRQRGLFVLQKNNSVNPYREAMEVPKNAS